MPIRIAPNGIGTKRPASRDLFEGAVRQTHHMRKIERLSRQTAGWRSSNKSSLHDVTEQAESKCCLPQTFSCERPGSSSLLDTALFQEGWWSRTGSNRRHPACKAGALPAELRPLILSMSEKWWAWEDLNLRPHAYQARALTN